MNFITYADLAQIVSNNLYKIPKDVDLIVGVPKSGMLVASMIALHLNLPLTDVDSLLEDKIFQSGYTKRKNNWITHPKEAKKILIVEDSSISGKSFNELKEKMEQYKYKNKLVYLIALVTEERKNLADIYLKICNAPRMFEWNYMHHAFLEKACVEIDGVLCQNPNEEEISNEENYIKFINNVKPRVIPTRKIGYLTTNRPEKYRKQTEKWLKKNNIQYDNLIMLDSKLKGQQYKQLEDTILFIESNPKVASKIATISNKPVFCVQNSKFYFEEHVDRTSIFRKLFRKLVPLKLRNFLRKIKNKIR